MERIITEPRQNWEQKLEERGFGFHSLEERYWDESAYYRFSAAEIQQIESATEELWQMCLDVVEYIIKNNLWYRFHIPEYFRKFVEQSWEEDHPSVYGRFDFGYDGQNLKLLEFNADTPTSLYEAAVIQWYWLQEKFPDADQFNSIHEKLTAYWTYLKKYMNPHHIYFTSLTNMEDVTNVEYMRDTASQAGFQTEFVPIQDIGWAESIKEFIASDRKIMEYIFKLYPYEWILQDGFGERLVENGYRSQWIEPSWKMLLSCKALLPVLWQLYPGHPLLLESYFEGGKLQEYVRKPLYSREGANVTMVKNNRVVTETSGMYGKEGYIYQKLYDLPDFGGNFPVVGSWIVGQEPAGIGIRESHELITDNHSRFLPHIMQD